MFCGQCASAEFAGVFEESVCAAVAVFAVVFVFREEPEADGNLRAVEKLAGEGDHAVHKVGLDEFLPDLALPWQALRRGFAFNKALSRMSVVRT